MNGNAFDTWKSKASPGMWIRDLLPGKYINARVILFGYNSDIKERLNQEGLTQWAVALLDDLRLIRISEKVSCHILETSSAI